MTKYRKIFFLPRFSSWTLAFHRTAGEGRGPSSCLYTISTPSRTFRLILATLHVKWLPCIFNWIALINVNFSFKWSYNINLMETSDGFELASTIILIEGVNWLMKHPSHHIFFHGSLHLYYQLMSTKFLIFVWCMTKYTYYS